MFTRYHRFSPLPGPSGPATSPLRARLFPPFFLDTGDPQGSQPWSTERNWTSSSVVYLLSWSSIRIEYGINLPLPERGPILAGRCECTTGDLKIGVPRQSSRNRVSDRMPVGPWREILVADRWEPTRRDPRGLRNWSSHRETRLPRHARNIAREPRLTSNAPRNVKFDGS